MLISDMFYQLYLIVVGEEPRRWINPDGTPSQWFIFNGVMYERG